MNNGEVKIGSSILPITEWQIHHRPVDAPVINFSKMIKEMQDVSIHVEGTLTQQDIEALLRSMYQNARDNPYCMYVDQETLWRLEYAWEGKRYPSPRKRKSKARMSKRWRKA
jgi:hypothetical protein